ncbi:MAG: GIN domain-containing protein [Stellaceae bacterium]
MADAKPRRRRRAAPPTGHCRYRADRRQLLRAGLVTLPLCLLAGSAAAQTGIIQQSNVSSRPGASQQNNLSINGESINSESSGATSSGGEGGSVTISGRSISVDTAATGTSRIIGDGQPASQQRPIGPVKTIHADGAFALTITVAPTPKLTVEADNNLLPIIKTTVAAGRLDIYADRSYSLDGRIKVIVASPAITDISASGSNQIEAAGFTGGALTVTLNGSNTASVSGQVATLSSVISGANHLSARGLSAGTAKLALNGSGNATVDARQAIAVQISGAGSITVYGNPKTRSTEVNGAGKITFAE